MLHLDPFGPPKPVRTMIRIRGQKMIKVRLPSGLSGGAPPYIGGNPPSGPAGAGRVGGITRGGTVDPFWMIFHDFSNF